MHIEKNKKLTNISNYLFSTYLFIYETYFVHNWLKEPPITKHILIIKYFTIFTSFHN
jgi:hypothetical protein